MHSLFAKLIPFLLIGIALVAFAFGIVLLAYLFFLGAVVGLVLFVFTWIREKFFRKKTNTPQTRKKAGRTIDSDDWKKL